jgi:hypothetical protein
MHPNETHHFGLQGNCACSRKWHLRERISIKREPGSEALRHERTPVIAVGICCSLTRDRIDKDLSARQFPLPITILNEEEFLLSRAVLKVVKQSWGHCLRAEDVRNKRQAKREGCHEGAKTGPHNFSPMKYRTSNLISCYKFSTAFLGRGFSPGEQN